MERGEAKSNFYIENVFFYITDGTLRSAAGPARWREEGSNADDPLQKNGHPPIMFFAVRKTPGDARL